MNTQEKAKQLIQYYCNYYGFEPEKLKRNNKYQPSRVILGEDGYINTSAIRMALGYFIYMHFPMRVIEVAKLVGYTDHSPLSSQRSTIQHYIKTEDPYFYPYYKKLLEFADLLDINTEYKRLTQNYATFVRHETNDEFAEQIKYYENA